MARRGEDVRNGLRNFSKTNGRNKRVDIVGIMGWRAMVGWSNRAVVGWGWERVGNLFRRDVEEGTKLLAKLGILQTNAFTRLRGSIMSFFLTLIGDFRSRFRWSLFGNIEKAAFDLDD